VATEHDRDLPLGVVLAALLLAGCREPADREAPSERGSPSRDPFLVEVTVERGFDLPPSERPAGSFFMPEITGTGAGLFDADGDGDLDIVLPRMPPFGQRDRPAPNRLYLQEPDGRFRDATADSGLGDPGFGQGVAIGDVDNDGDLDLFFSNFGRDRLYWNDGSGHFREASDAGLDGEHWSTSATFCDVDRDGHLDLYVAHYLSYEHRAHCYDLSSAADYCGPEAFGGDADTLYRNDGDGTFTDVSVEAGIRPPRIGRSAKGLGVICADLTADGWPDVFVANDGMPNHLWVNQGGGRFEEQALARGVAVNFHGVPEANMGIAVGDADGDLQLDLHVTHLAGENNSLYCGAAGGLFDDRTVQSGLARHDLALTGFGTAFLDLEHDGDLDLAVANGRVRRGERAGDRLGPFWSLYAEAQLLLLNDGAGEYENAMTRAGRFAETAVGRGLAFGDLDDDGDLDLVLTETDNVVRLFRNDAPPAGQHWLLVRAVTGRRDAIGARVTASAGGRRQLRLVQPGTSYLCSNDPRVHFGLGPASRYDAVEVEWPDGSRERFPGGAADRVITITQGTGTAA
jgi:hypothetical protein